MTWGSDLVDGPCHSTRPLLTLNAVLADGIPPLVAHQGGWDEILLVAGPMAFVAALLWVARRRIRRDEVS